MNNEDDIDCEMHRNLPPIPTMAADVRILSNRSKEITSSLKNVRYEDQVRTVLGRILREYGMG
jgi:hypothetical protein